MMKELKRPGLEEWWESFAGSAPLAWKTGTSYGNKDTWALGTSPQWTIGIWVGNFSGRENANLRSITCAAPLLFNVFNFLPKETAGRWFEKPVSDLKLVRICMDTGYLAGPDCPNVSLVAAPKQAQNMRICPYHKTIYVSENGKYEVCSLCWKPGHYRKEVRLCYPPQVVQYLREQGYDIDYIPTHNPSCPALGTNSPLRIIYPQNKSMILVPRDLDGKLQKIGLKAAHREAKQTIFWYLDREYLGNTKEPHTIFCGRLEEGWHTLEILDSCGNRSRIEFYTDYVMY